MPYLQPQTVNLSFQGGLQAKTDALQLQPPALLELQNGLFDKTGQLNKRYGYNIFGTNVLNGNQITSAVAIDDFNNELNLFDNQNIYTWIGANGNWANRGTAISLVNRNSPIVRNNNQQLNPDCATLNGITVYAWEDTRGGIRYSVADQITGAYCIADKSVSTIAAKPKCLVANGLIYILYTDLLNNIYYVTINPANPTILSVQTSIAADATNNSAYDATVVGLNIVFAYVNASLNVQVASLDYTQTVHYGAHLLIDGYAISCLSVVVDSISQVWVSYGDVHGVHTGGFVYTAPGTFNNNINPAILIDSAQVSTLSAIESTNVGTLQLCYEVIGASPINQLVKTVTVTNGSVVSPIGTQRGVGLASKPFRYLNNIYINTAFQSTLQSTYFTQLISSAPFTIVGKVNPQLGGGYRTNGMMAEVATLSSGTFLWPNLVKGQFISEDNVAFTLLGVNSTITDFTNPSKFNSTTFSNNLLFVGGILQSYDGQSCVEQNFHIFPEGGTASPQGYGGALSAGQYQYQIVYAWTDKFGQIQYGTPSQALTVTTVIDDSVIIAVPTLRLTAKTGVVIKIYRTQVNQTTFQEVTSELAPLLNNPNLDFVFFTDTAADINIAGNQTIYTTGGVLPNAAPPSCSLISLYQDRVIISGLEDSNQLWFSKNHVNNQNASTIPVEFSAYNTLNINPTSGPGQTGPITALAQMSGNLVIFKESAIYILSGSGPNDEGGGDTFPDPQLITQSVGCTNPNSLILTDQGLFFQSPDKGIWLLNLSLGPPQYIGAAVDDTAKQYPISGAIQDPKNNLIVFTTYNGPAMVYDYYAQQWSLWTNHQAEDAIIFGGLITFVNAKGQIYQQNRSIFYDGVNGDGYQVPIVLEFITPWISYNSTLGYMSIMRAFLLGQYRGPHNLNVSVGYNFDPAFTKAGVINTTSTAGSNVWGSDGYWGESTPWGSVWMPYMYQINMPIQKCTSFRLKFSDAGIGTTPNEGFTANSLRFELGQLAGSVKLPVTNKVGLQ
jgi:hypothetical protein